MNKKLLLIPIVIGLLLFIILRPPTKSGNKFEMVIPENSEKASEGNELKGLTVYLDNSGSMKGFLDFASMPNGNEANATFIGTLSNFMDKVKSSYNIEPTCDCGGTSYNRSGFLEGMGNFSIFKGAVTELHKAVTKLVETTTDSTISVLASDMVLSYGKKSLLGKGKYYNKQQLEQLGAYVHDAMTNAKDRGFHALLLQYYGDYNGDYYCNYTENIDPNLYKGKLMLKRPYYLLIVGKESILKNLASQRVFMRPSHVYSTFDVPVPQKKQPFEVQQNDESVAWLIGNPDPKYADETGTIMTNTDFGNALSSVKILYSHFEIPAYVSVKENGKLKPEWDNNVIQNVSIESDANADKQVLIVTFNPHNTLETTKGVSIRLCSDNDWLNSATTLDDTEGKDISKKTWGFSTIVKNINKVYRSEEELQPEIIAKLSFDILIK